RRRRRSVGDGVVGVGEEVIDSAVVEGAACEETPAPVSGVGFTTAKALAETEAADSRKAAVATAAAVVGGQERCCSPAAVAKSVSESDGATTESRQCGGSGGDGDLQRDGGSAHVGGEAGQDQEEEEEEEEAQESEVVVLGERGSNLILKFFVEEVPEEEEVGGCGGGEGGDEGVCLAVQVAMDQPNRIALRLSLADGLEGPSKVSADKRWTSDQLREAVAAAIGRENRSFRLRKNQSHTAEIRPGPETLARQGFYNLMTLHVSPGRPLELHEEAITVAPVDVGFEAGLGPVPLSVLEALAAGRPERTGNGGSGVDHEEAAAAAAAAAAKAAAVADAGHGGEEGAVAGLRGPPTELGGVGAAGDEDEDASVAACCSLKFPEVDAETGPVREAAACDATAPPSAECSPCLGPLGAGGVGGSGSGGSGSNVVSPALLLTLRGVGAAEEEGGGDSEAPTASVSSSETGLTTPTNYRLGMTAAAAENQAAPLPAPAPASTTAPVATGGSSMAAAAAAAASAHPLAHATLPGEVGETADGVATPTTQTNLAWAVASAAAAAAAQSAKAETERLTSTHVEVAPPERRWGEQFTIAVDRDSTVGDIRRAVWAEMHRRGLGPKRISLPPSSPLPPRPASSSSSLARGGEGDKNTAGTILRNPLEGEGDGAGWTPGMLRLRERQVKLPATILRDSEGKVVRLRSRPAGVPWLLAAQVLPSEEDLGTPVPSSAGSGGGGGKKAGRADGGGAGDAGGRESECSPAHALPLPPHLLPLPEDAKVIVVQWWDRWEWRLTEKYEAWISPSETVAEARRRLAQQAGVDPAHLLANKCASTARLRLFDLRGDSEDGGGGGGGSSSNPRTSGTWSSSSSSSSSYNNNRCRWDDLERSRGDQPVGDLTASEGSLFLLQDASQPLKQLTAAAEASIAGGGGGGDNGGGTRETDAATGGSDGCALSSVGSWYAGGAAGDGGGGGAASPTTSAGTTALALPANRAASSSSSSSSSAYSFKPKERALRIRTRRDRLEEGRVVAAAAAAAAAAKKSPPVEEAAAACAGLGTEGDGGGGGGGGGGSRSPGASSDVTVGDTGAADALSSGEETVGT
ncbi:unnamed protein product, partial [Scytosiphon promiscuus]